MENFSEDQMVIHRFNKYFLFKQIKLEGDEMPYYVLVLKQENPWDLLLLRKDFDAILKILKDIMHQ
jgi:hypothetical protein